MAASLTLWSDGILCHFCCSVFFLLEDENKNPVIERKVQISLMKSLPFYH